MTKPSENTERSATPEIATDTDATFDRTPTAQDGASRTRVLVKGASKLVEVA